MKKKFLILMVVAIIAVISLSGCTFVRLNVDRQAGTVLRTVEKGDVSLDITYMELTDYTYNLLFGNSYYYYYISQGVATLEDVVQSAVSLKTQSKALTISAMEYLADVAGRADAKLDAEATYKELTKIYGDDYLNKKVMSYLTVAEYYDAISSVNTTIEDLYEGFLEENADEERAEEIRGLVLENVKEITIIEGVKDEYYVGESGPQTKNLKLRLEYLNGDTIDIPVTEAMVKTEFSSSEAGSFEFNIDLDVMVKNGDKLEETTMTASKEYEVVEAPKTKADTDEKEAYLDIIRYMTKAEIAQWAETPEAKSYEYKIPEVIDLEANYKGAADANSKKAWEKTIEYFNNANRTVDYYYESAFETAILEAYRAEIYNVVEAAYRSGNTEEFNAQFNTEVADKIAELGGIDEKAFDKLSAKEKKTSFINAIGDVLDKLYYVPTDLAQGKGYVYVSHMLLQFNEDKYPFIVNTEPSDAAIADYINSTTVDELNPRFDVAFVCEGWEYNAEGEYVHNAAKCSDSDSDNLLKQDKSNCKSIAYTDRDIAATTVLGNLADALKDKTGQEAVTIFNEYVEKYGMDSGILDKTNGYLITPDVADMSWVDGFESLGIVLAASANYQNAGTYAPNKTVATQAMAGLYGINEAEAGNLYDKYMEDVFAFESGNGNKIYYCVGKTLSSSSGTISGYAGIHVMMVTFCPFANAFGTEGSWTGDNIIDLKGTDLKKAVADNILETKQSTEYTAVTKWTTDFEQDDNGYGMELGEGYKGFTITDNKKLVDYVEKIMEAYTA